MFCSVLCCLCFIVNSFLGFSAPRDSQNVPNTFTINFQWVAPWCLRIPHWIFLDGNTTNRVVSWRRLKSHFPSHLYLFSHFFFWHSNAIIRWWHDIHYFQKFHIQRSCAHTRRYRLEFFDSDSHYGLPLWGRLALRLAMCRRPPLERWLCLGCQIAVEATAINP